MRVWLLSTVLEAQLREDPSDLANWTRGVAIDGAKNFGRFEAFFLPAARCEQVREASGREPGSPSIPLRRSSN